MFEKISCNRLMLALMAAQEAASQEKNINLQLNIATEAHEQSNGLSEVNMAVNQMDQVTHQNAAMAEEAVYLKTRTSRFKVSCESKAIRRAA